MYQIQIRKRNCTNAEWLPLYSGHETYDLLTDAVKRYFLIRRNHVLNGITMWEMRICKVAV